MLSIEKWYHIKMSKLQKMIPKSETGGREMSGPALRQLSSHQSIHDGYYTEGRDLTELLVSLFNEQRLDDCREVSKALVEHWETRMIAHADAEEEGFYLEVMGKYPELETQLTKLVRDHELLRLVVADVKECIQQEGMTLRVIDLFKGILLLVEIHSREEEKHLFIHEHLRELHDHDELKNLG